MIRHATSPYVVIDKKQSQTSTKMQEQMKKVMLQDFLDNQLIAHQYLQA